MNPTCADCKNWNPDGRCASGTPTAEPWRRRNRVTPGLTGTIIPATECPAFDALVPARKPTKRRPTKIPLRYRRFSPAGCTSPATAAAAVATEATRVLEPLALDGEGIAEVVGRLVGAVDRERADYERVIDGVAKAAAATLDERDQARAELSTLRKARSADAAVIGSAADTLDRLGVGSGLLPDRVLALAVERETAREERNRARAQLAAAEMRLENERGIVFAAVVVLSAVLTAAILFALDILPTLSVA